MSQTPRFRLPLRIYWEDTDAGGVVFYANYLKFFERARTEWLRSLGFEQEALRRGAGIVFVVTDTQLRYLAPARLDDHVEVTVDSAQQGPASVKFAQRVLRQMCDGSETVLTEGSIRVGCVDLASFRPRRIPIDISRAMT